MISKATIIMLSVLLLSTVMLHSLPITIQVHESYFSVRLLVSSQTDRNNTIYLLVFNETLWPFPNNTSINPSNIYITLDNGTPLHYFVAWFDQKNRFAEIWVRGPVSNSTVIRINYNLSSNPYKEYCDPKSIFSLFYLYPSQFSPDTWYVVNGDPEKGNLTITDDSITLFMGITSNNVLALAGKKPFHPPIGVYLVFDPTYVIGSNIGLDSAFGLVDNNIIPAHYIPYFSSFANGFIFEDIDHFWPNLRFVYNKTVYMNDTGREGALGFEGKASILGIVKENSSKWIISDYKKRRIIELHQASPSVLYPVFYVKGNLVYPSGLKIYFLGLFDLSSYVPIKIVKILNIKETMISSEETSMTSNTINVTKSPQTQTTSPKPLTNTEGTILNSLSSTSKPNILTHTTSAGQSNTNTSVTYKFNLTEMKLFNISKDFWIRIAIISFAIFILGLAMGIIIKKKEGQ